MEFDSSEFRDFGQGDKDSMTDIGALYASLAPTILVSSDEEEAEAPARGSPRESCTEPNESVEDEALPSSCQSVQEAVPGTRSTDQHLQKMSYQSQSKGFCRWQQQAYCT